jgi:hypothetical protein
MSATAKVRLENLATPKIKPVPIEGKIQFPVAPPGAMMSISFESDETILDKLRERLRLMTDEELIRFGKDLRRLAENPFQRQLEEARKEWKRRRASESEK